MENSCPILMKVGPSARRLSLTQMAVFRCLALCLHMQFSSSSMDGARRHTRFLTAQALCPRTLHQDSGLPPDAQCIGCTSCLWVGRKHPGSLPLRCHATRVCPFLAVQSQPQSASQNEVPDCCCAQGRGVVIPRPVKVPHRNLGTLCTCTEAKRGTRKHHSAMSGHGHCITSMM